MKKVGIFGSEYQADKQLVIKRLFENWLLWRLRFSWTVLFISSLRMR